MHINILEAKNRLSQLIKAALGGEEVVIANRGAPMVRLVPVATPAGAARGSASAILAWLGDHPLPAYARRSAEEIDSAIEAERGAWE